jgi:hypothetical protein
MIDLGIFTAPGGRRLALAGLGATGGAMSSNLQGDERISCTYPLRLVPDGFALAAAAGTLHAQVNADGARAIFEGRVENPTLTDNGTTVEALGYSRALTDLPYTAVWSDTTLERWRVLRETDLAAILANRANYDQQNRLYLSPEKNATWPNAASTAGYLYEPPDGGQRQIVGYSYDFAVLLPANFRVELYRANAALGVFTLLHQINTTGVLQTGSRNFSFTADDRLLWDVYNNTGAPVVYAPENDAGYVKITNSRVVTSIANRINTTFTANRAAGANVTATVGSTARMYVGQRLQIVGAAVSESVIVLSIGSTTQFNATFANAYVIGETVQAHVVYADEVAGHIAAAINGVNSTQLSSSTALIQSPGRDLLDAFWEDTTGDAILSDLAQRGDTQTVPRRWVWSIESGRRLRFAPLGNGNKTWYVDAATLQVQISRQDLYNDAYATYQDAAGRTLRTATNPNTQSVARYALTRRQAVQGQGTDLLQAQAARDTAIAQGAFPPPKVQVTFPAAYDAGGARAPLYLVRGGDLVIIRNLPPAPTTTTLDQVRSFIVARAEYHMDDDTLTVEPLDPLPTIEAALA